MKLTTICAIALGAAFVALSTTSCASADSKTPSVVAANIASPSIVGHLSDTVAPVATVLPTGTSGASLEATADRLTSLLDTQQGGSSTGPDGKPYGYAGIRIDQSRQLLTLYWVGPVPESVKSIVRDGAGFTARAVAAKVTFYQDRAGMKALALAERQGMLPRGVKIGFITGSVRGAGLVVEYRGVKQSSVRDSSLSKLFSMIAKVPSQAKYSTAVMIEE